MTAPAGGSGRNVLASTIAAENTELRRAAIGICQMFADKATTITWTSLWDDARTWLADDPDGAGLDAATVTANIDTLMPTATLILAHPAMFAAWLAQHERGPRNGIYLANVSHGHDLHLNAVTVRASGSRRPVDHYTATDTGELGIPVTAGHLPHVPMSAAERDVYATLRADGATIAQALSAITDITLTPARERERADQARAR